MALMAIFNVVFGVKIEELKRNLDAVGKDLRAINETQLGKEAVALKKMLDGLDYEANFLLKKPKSNGQKQYALDKKLVRITATKRHSIVHNHQKLAN